MNLEYEELLKRAKEKLPSLSEETKRFEVPKVRGHVEGNKTIISNFIQIANILNRAKEHLLKFLLKELATPGEMKGELLVLGTKVSSERINEKIKKYVEEYILCKTCGKPDTKLEKEGDFLYLICQACGAKRLVKSV
ncbi:MAG: translation initiation factor IF-2 subunit beta [Candidatus Woesearchaeota archaeon]